MLSLKAFSKPKSVLIQTPIPSLKDKLKITVDYQGERLLIKGDYPARVRIGDIIMENSAVKKVSPINGIAKIDADNDCISFTIDGELNRGSTFNPKKYKLGEMVSVLLNSGLVSLDFKGLGISRLFQILATHSNPYIVLSPFSLENHIDFKEIILKEFNDGFTLFKQTLLELMPESTVMDYISDKKYNYHYPDGNPNYFLLKYCGIELVTKIEESKVFYLGAETLYHIIRALYYGVPFHERHCTFYWKSKEGRVEAKKTFVLKNGQNLYDFFYNYKDSYKQFTINSFYNHQSVYQTGSEFIVDIYQYNSFILCDDEPRNLKERICIDCDDCTAFCPVDANPRGLLDKKDGEFQSQACIECGICSVICPSHIDFYTRITASKKEN